MPGLLAAGIGALIFVGLDSWTGFGTFSLAIPNIPHFGTPDGAELIALGVESQALHVWDLRLIREQLAPMGLDWGAPAYPPPGPAAAPLSVTVDLGGLKK